MSGQFQQEAAGSGRGAQRPDAIFPPTDGRRHGDDDSEYPGPSAALRVAPPQLAGGAADFGRWPGSPQIFPGVLWDVAHLLPPGLSRKEPNCPSWLSTCLMSTMT